MSALFLVFVFFFVFFFGYLCGLFPSGPWVARRSLGGRNLTDLGSGSTGATNVLRYAGWGSAVLVVLLDMMKAVVAILLAGYTADLLALRFGYVASFAWAESFAAVGCLFGHCFPVWSRGLRGGKGVASTMGVLLILAPWVLCVAVVLWLGLLGLWGFSSLASLGVCLFLLLASLFWLEGAVAWGVVVIVLMVGFRHRENVRRLWRDEEKRVFGGLWRRGR